MYGTPLEISAAVSIQGYMVEQCKNDTGHFQHASRNHSDTVNHSATSDGNSLLNSVTNSNRSCSFRKSGFLICSLHISLFYTNDSFTNHSIGTLRRKRSNEHSKRIQVHDTMKSFLYLISKLRGITLYINEKWFQ